MAPNELIGASPQRRRGRPRKPPRTCEIDGCSNTGERYIENDDDKVFVCSTHRSRRDRETKTICSARGCSGVVRLGKTRERHWCRSHEDRYLTEDAEAVEKALAFIASKTDDGIGVSGCWMFEGRTDRPDVKVFASPIMTWRITRLLWVYFYGPHRGGLELHHVCDTSWCVNPSHLWPVTRKFNKEVENHLDSYLGPQFLNRFAPITDVFDSWCRDNGIRHGMEDHLDRGNRRTLDSIREY